MMDGHRRAYRYKHFTQRIITNNNNQYGGHDDRDSNNPNNSYNVYDNNKKGKLYNRNRQGDFRKVKRYNTQGRTTIDRRNRIDEDVDDSETWFKIVVQRGGKSSKEQLMSQFQQNSGIVFMPFNYHIEKDSAVFFVQGGDQMAALRACSRRIYGIDGCALSVNVQPSSIPVPPINKKVEDSITNVLKSRFNYSIKSLFLNSFYQDRNFLESDLFIPLSRIPIFNLIVEKIRKEYSEIVGLSLADNKLATLSPLSHLPSICKNLKALDISKNKIKTISELDNIKGFELVELAIEGNPFANAAAFSEAEKTTLVSSLRKRFPKLTKLDGADLPPAIGFDVGDTDDLPTSYGHHIPNEIKDFVAQFLDQYFKIYDSDDRRSIHRAYHDHAVFSYSIGRTDNKVNTFTQSMITGSRNLLRIREDGETKTKLLHVGGQAIVDALSAMPRTKHAPSLMKIDVPFYVPNCSIVVVNGVFKEFTKKQVLTRAFGRTFIIVPQGGGFVIINDILVITNATVDQVQKFSRSLENESILACIKDDPFGSDGLASLSLAGLQDANFNLQQQLNPIQGNPGPMMDDATKDSMVQQFCSMTNMNPQFSAQCLAENAFDLQKSFDVFTQLNKQGAIPAAAFQ